MIITKQYAKRLIKLGKARAEGTCLHDNARYVIITRYDMQRVDHYFLTDIQAIKMTPEKIKAWREKHKITQQKLAELLEISICAVNSWENKTRKPVGKLLEFALAELSRRLKNKKL